jgi:phospholipid/cholesterol/gamma-HCH transport system substrate-binding protein
MRRSVREAIVGFTLLAALAGGGAFWLWLQGVSAARRHWTFSVSFADAAGLGERSAVTYRGVQVGNVRQLRTTADAVVAELDITDQTLRLPMPLVAQVEAASLLGGDAMVALLAPPRRLPPGTPGPRDPGCNRQLTVCPGMQLQGISAASLTSVTATMQKLLDEADRLKLVSSLASNSRSFDSTARQADRFLVEGQQLIRDLQTAVEQARPTLDNLNASTAHIRNLSRALDNPKVVSDLQGTVANAERLTARWDQVGGDVNKLTADPRFMDGVRSVAVGLGKFFDELYPASTGAAKDKATREAVQVPASPKPR